MAAKRPMAVAKRASAIPGATTARLVFLEAPMCWKDVMIPHTVPKSPTNGATEPVVASMGSQASMDSSSRRAVASIMRRTRWRAVPSRRSSSEAAFHSSCPTTNTLARGWSPCWGLTWRVKLSSVWEPDQKMSSKSSALRCSALNWRDLATHTAHTVTEAANSPNMMSLTKRPACKNRPQNDISTVAATAVGSI